MKASVCTRADLRRKDFHLEPRLNDTVGIFEDVQQAGQNQWGRKENICAVRGHPQGTFVRVGVVHVGGAARTGTRKNIVYECCAP